MWLKTVVDPGKGLMVHWGHVTFNGYPLFCVLTLELVQQFSEQGH